MSSRVGHDDVIDWLQGETYHSANERRIATLGVRALLLPKNAGIIRGAVLVATVCSLLAVPSFASALKISAVQPQADLSDLADASYQRATVSSNGDGVNDVLRVTVQGTPNTRIVLKGVGTHSTIYASAVTDGSGAASLSYTPKSSPATSWQVLRVCELSGNCTSQRIHLALRSLSVAVDTLSGVRPGDSVDVVVSADAPVHLALVDLADPASIPQPFGIVQPGRTRFVVPAIRSSLWGVRATAADGTIRIAPLIVEPVSFSATGPAVAVVPMLTMRAYNAADNDRDGRPDTWYVGPRPTGTPISGPLDPAADGTWRRSDRLLAALRFLRRGGHDVQVISDYDLPAVIGRPARAFRTLAFLGHEEYYTLPMWSAVMRYRNAGGRLFFMQANSFYTRVVISGGRMRIRDFAMRQPSRSDFGLAGGGYATCCWSHALHPVHRVMPGAVAALPWLFAGTGLQAGDVLGYILGEADRSDARLSPRGLITIASGSIGNAHSDVVYYRRPDGAEVLDLGTVMALGQLEDPSVPQSVKRPYARFVENAWRHLTRPRGD